jgi:DNA-directed RNA polymerase subunit RPC12/RpoP
MPMVIREVQCPHCGSHDLSAMRDDVARALQPEVRKAVPMLCPECARLFLHRVYHSIRDKLGFSPL